MARPPTVFLCGMASLAFRDLLNFWLLKLGCFWRMNKDTLDVLVWDLIRLKTLMCTCAPYSEQNIRSVWPVEKSACFIENRRVKHLRIQQDSIVQKFFQVFCSFAFLQGSLHSIRWFWGISTQKAYDSVDKLMGFPGLRLKGDGWCFPPTKIRPLKFPTQKNTTTKLRWIRRIACI